MKTITACLILFLAGVAAGAGRTVVLQQGVAPDKSYAGCRTATLWKKPARPTDGNRFLYLRGEDNRMLIRFDIPADLKSKALARARLWVFLPKADDEDRYTEIVCNGMGAPWEASATWAQAAPGRKWRFPGGVFDNRTNYHNGRFLGATDSHELYAHQRHPYWQPHMKWLPVSVPAGGMWVSFNVTPLAERWLANPAANLGVMLSCHHADRRMPNPWSIDIPSETYTHAAKRPKLELELREGLAQPVRVAMVPSLRRINPWSSRYRYRGEYNRQYTMQMAANEWEGFQVVVDPVLADLANVSFKATALTDKSTGAALPADSVRWFCQDVVHMSTNWVVRDVCLGDKRYWVPDPLVPARLSPAKWKTVRRQQATPFWFTVRAPPGTKPGRYTGTITMSADGCKPVDCKLTVEVWDYEIPAKWHYSIVGSFGYDGVRKFYGSDYKPEMMDRWYDFLLDHRLAPTEQYATRLSPRAERLRHCIARGMNVLYVQGNLKLSSDLTALKRQYEQVKQMGLTDHAVIYVEDEGHRQEMRRQLSKRVREAAPEAMMMVGGARPDPEVWGYVDVWDPEIDQWPGHVLVDMGKYKLKKDKMTAAEARKVVEAAQARGEWFFWYVAASPTPPYPNVQLEYPLIAARVFTGVMSWKYRVEGFEYYCYSLWGNNMKRARRWPEAPWDVRGFKNYNSDGILFYPGPDGTPCSSVRLENIRDGVEDWESFYILRDYADALRATNPKGKPADLLKTADALLDVPDDVVTSVTIWTQDPDRLLKTRKAVGDAIVALKALVPAGEYRKVRDGREAARLAARRKMLADRVAGRLPATQPAK